MSSFGLFVPETPITRIGLLPRGLFLQSGTVQLIQGDTLEKLKALPSDHFHCCVTSPPYYGLRSYLPDNHPDKAKEIGNELDANDYVERIVAVCEEVRRVLRPDGTFWLNIGDSYAAVGNKTPGVKAKDLIGVPWMLAFALRAKGWYVRSDVIWHKLKMAPDSARDRPSNCVEHMFMLTKNANYYWDQEAIREVGSEPAGRIIKGGAARRKIGEDTGYVNALDSAKAYEYDGTRNIRNVWVLNPHTASNAHFALMPSKLIEPCIMASTSEHGCCTACGVPWKRMPFVEETTGMTRRGPRGSNEWESNCECNAGVEPCRVLDPFGGMGTVGLVAALISRHATLIELSVDYVNKTADRLRTESINCVVVKPVAARRRKAPVYNTVATPTRPAFPTR